MIQMGFLKVRGSDYTRERWEQIKALRVSPRMFHNDGTYVKYPVTLISSPNRRPAVGRVR
jgi:hypothetical protein